MIQGSFLDREERIMAELTMDKLVALCKNRGFIFAGSEIYGGLATHADITRVTQRLGDEIGKVYSWDFPQRAVEQKDMER